MGSGEAKPASQRKAPQGLYMFGGVGVGKTMLMDLLVTAAPPEFKVPSHPHTTCHHWLLRMCVSSTLHVVSKLRACLFDLMLLCCSSGARTSTTLCWMCMRGCRSTAPTAMLSTWCASIPVL